MFHEGSGSAGWLAAVVLTLTMGLAPAGAQELRTVLQTGDEVPRFGRIGVWGLHLAGIDDRGRALVAHVGAGESDAAYWADGERFVPLLDPAQAAGVTLLGTTLAVQAGGAVIGRGFAGIGRNRPYTLFLIADGVARALLREGDVDPHGNAVCEVRNAVVNARGTVAIHALIRRAGSACGGDDGSGGGYSEALYLDDGQLVRVAATIPLSPAGWELHQLGLYAINEADEALVYAWGAATSGGAAPQQHLLAVGHDGVRLVYRAGESDGPNQIGMGSDPGYFQILAVNGAGDAIFRRYDDVLALYRTAGDQRVRLMAAGEPAAWGGHYTESDIYSWPTTFADNGDVLLSVGGPERLVLYPADGAPLVIDGTYYGYLNGRRDIAALRRAGDHGSEIVRYRNGGARRLARTGDRLPGGAVLAAAGLGAACMAPNGALAVSVTNAGSDTALVCRDGRGVRTVSRMGDPRPDRRRFYGFDSCAFAGADQLVFIGSGLVPSGRTRDYFLQRAVYRATAQRLERVFGPGDTLDDGSVIRGLLSGWEYLLDADASGRVTALAATSQGSALVLAEADGTLRRVPLSIRNYASYGDRVSFEPDSSVDHEYLAGISDRPQASSRGAQPAPASRGALRGMPAPEDVDPDAVWISAVGLAESGGVFVLGSRQIQVAEDAWNEQSVLLLVDGAVVQEIDDPSIYRDSLDAMFGGGDRIVYLSRGGDAWVETYSRGDALPVVVARSGDATPLGPLSYPQPLGISRDGEVYFTDTPQGSDEATAFAVRDGALRVLGPVRSLNLTTNAVSDDGLLVSSLDRLQVSGPEVRGASCPLPPVLAPAPPEPTRTPRPGEELPPDLPFEPQRCSAGPCLSVTSASGLPGDVVSIDVWIDDDGIDITATENELAFPLLAQIESCAVNPDIDKNGSAFRIDADYFKAIVIALDNVVPIPGGSTLYTCQVRIAADAPPGNYQLGCALPGAASPEGEEVSISCADGVLTVEGDDNSGESPQVAASNSGGGCTVQAPAEPGGALLMLLGAAAWLAARRRRTR